MDMKLLLSINELATSLALNLLSGKSTMIGNAVALEQIVVNAMALHKAEVGTPMDLNKFQKEDHVD